MLSNHYHIQDPVDGFPRTEEPSERCMEPLFAHPSPTFIASLDPILLDTIFSSLDMQLPTDLPGIDPALDASSSASPVSVIYDGDAYFDLETGLWVPTQPTSSPVEAFLPSPVEPFLSTPEEMVLFAAFQNSSPANFPLEFHSPASPPPLSTPTSQGPSSRTTSPGFSPMPAAPNAFPCPHPGCSRSFDTASDLQKHRRAHNKRFLCRTCGKAHTDQRGLDRHMESRHRVLTAKSETRKCRVCDRVGRGDNIKRHEKGQHGLQ
ncbi:hypothetical protein B0T18DRAFT_425993 [Schizothecium vesticola]|uniref:C2H2-type domain-containing protein n=1 Tax=Schizothecium vesticola TaxID=314040 RepID=A0AA40F4Z1_9PEZI|nr:hypothetical protein B0T18DRAFT_425993 [Schizothecium vesticola]